MKSESFQFEGAGQSSAGRVRELNEDAVAVDAARGFAVVADGMGGHRAGEVASRMALEAVVGRLRSGERPPSPVPTSWLEDAINRANALVYSAACQQKQCKGMGTTLALLLFDGPCALLAHVGDSRIYRLRQGQLELLTRDDSLLSDQVERGLIGIEDAGDSHNRHLVTQALGVGESVVVHWRSEEWRAGDVYLLCTDGLNDLVDDTDIELIVDSLKTNLPLAASHLVQLANDLGGYDNITVALLRVPGDETQTKGKGWLARLFGWLPV